MAEIVVTGSQGFLGRHLMRRLDEMGADICGTYSYTLPNYPTKYKRNYFKLDATRFEDCLKLINQENPKVIYHLVAQPVVTAAKRHPFSTFELTIRGTYNLLEAIRQTGKPSAIIVISSDKVYGENENATESSPLASDHPYNVAKVCEDLISQSYAKSFGLPVAVIRSANIYGEGDFHWDRLVPSVCRDIAMNVHPMIRSTGLQKRDYIYIDDILDGYMLITDALQKKKLVYGSPINFGAIRPHTALEITDFLLKAAGRIDLEPNILGGGDSEIPAQHINYEYVQKTFGWSPKTLIEDGLQRTFFWYKKYFGVS